MWHPVTSTNSQSYKICVMLHSCFSFKSIAVFVTTWTVEKHVTVKRYLSHLKPKIRHVRVIKCVPASGIQQLLICVDVLIFWLHIKFVSSTMHIGKNDLVSGWLSNRSPVCQIFWCPPPPQKKKKRSSIKRVYPGKVTGQKIACVANRRYLQWQVC